MKTILITALCLLLGLTAFAQSDQLALKSTQARDLMSAGKFSEAAVIYRELNQAVPNNPGLLLNLGMALQMSGDDRKAVPSLEAAVKLDPNLTPAWLFLGMARLKSGRASSAVDALTRVLHLQPDHEGARVSLAEALLSLNRVSDGAEQYRTLSELHPESASAWYGLGRSYESLSIRAFNALEKGGQGSVYWLVLTAETRLREQQFSSAFYLYRQALEKAPEMPGLHAALAEIYRKTEHQDWAALEEDKERQLPKPDCSLHKMECSFDSGRYPEVLAAARNSNSPESRYWTARAYNQLALRAFARLGELPPSSEQHQLKAQIYTTQKRYSEAAAEWQQALRLSPGNPQLEEQLGISLKFNQEYAQALPIFQALVRRQPGSAELNYLAGDTLLDLQRPEEAIPLLKRALELAPEFLSAHKSLARADLAIGNGAGAIPHLKRSLASDTDGSLHFQLARAYQAAGQPELANPLLAEYEKMRAAAAADSQSSQDQLKITPP